MALGEWLSRLLGRKRPAPAKPLSPAEEMKAALAELQVQQGGKKGRRRRKQKRPDGYRELVLDGAADVQLSEALLHLTHETHKNKDRLVEEEKAPTVDVESHRDDAGDTAQQRADHATRHLRAYMEQEGQPETTHYYSQSERAQTGEVDRTSDTDGTVESD